MRKRLVIVLLLTSMLFSLVPIIPVMAQTTNLSSEISQSRTFVSDDLSDIQKRGFAAGTVLHYMDFTKISSWADTGYFLTNNSTPSSFELESEKGLKIGSSNNRNVSLLFTGNKIPQMLTDYTVILDFCFANNTGNNGYFGLIMGGTQTAAYSDGSLIESGTLALSETRNTTYSYNSGNINSDGSDASNIDHTLNTSLKNNISNKKDVTMTFSFVNRRIGGQSNDGNAYDYGNIKIECDGVTDTVKKNSLNWSHDEGYMGLTLGNGAVVYVKSVTIIAGVNESVLENGNFDSSVEKYSALIWPDGEGELVQEARYSPAYITGCQTKTNASGTLDLRLIGGVDIQNLNLYDSVGFEVTVNDGTKDLIKEEVLSTSTVYDSIRAGDDTYRAEDLNAEHISVLSIQNFDPAKVYTVQVRSFVQNDSLTLWDEAQTITVAKNFESDTYGTVPAFRIATTCLTAGDELYGSWSAVYVNTTENEYNTYLETLKAAGFSEHQSSTQNGNLFATYQNEKTILSVNYIAYNKTVRIAADPKSTKALFDATADTVGGVTPQLTQWNGVAGFLIRLSDGRFIVYDGGMPYESNYDTLYDQLVAQNQNGTKPVIAAWIFSHMHNDHVGTFVEFTTKHAAKVEIQSLVLNIPSYDIYTQNGTVPAASMTEYIGYLKDAIATYCSGANIIIPHAGQTMYFADAAVRVMGGL